MKRSTLLNLANQAWHSHEKEQHTADLLADSGLFSSADIYAITQVVIPPNALMYAKHAWDSLNPATLDILYGIALLVEADVRPSDKLIALVVEEGTTRSVIERLTGYDSYDPGRERPATDGKSVRDS